MATIDDYRPAAQVATTLLAVLVFTHIGGAFGMPPTGVSAYWPANAIFFAALLLIDHRARIACFALGYPVYVIAELGNGFALHQAVVFSLANCAEVGVAIALGLRLMGPAFELLRLKQLFALLIVAAIASPIGGVIGALGVALTDGPFLSTLLQWSLADFVGFLVFAPLVLTLPLWQRWLALASRRQRLEVVLAVSLLATSSLVLHGPVSVAGIDISGLQFLALPVMLWIALRCGPNGAALASLVASASAIWLARQGVGPFADLSPASNVASLQVFVTSIVFAVVGASLLMAERDSALVALEHARDQLRYKIDEQTAELSEMLDKYKSLVDFAPMCIHEIDLDGRLLSMNAAGLVMLGAHNEDEVRGLDYTNFPDPEDQPHIASLLEGARRGEASQFEFSATTDAGRMHFSSCFVPIKDATGDVVRIIGVTENTTQRVETEAQLRRTQRLEAIGQLTGGVAHDFNNLLAVIMGNCELLALKAPEHEELIAPILASTQQGADLTRRLLSFARQQRLRPQPVDLARHLQAMQPLLARTLGETIDTAIVIDQAPHVAMVDASQFESAILNLAINARDAMPNGGRLEISCAGATSLPGGQSHVIVGVADTGSGMNEDVRLRAFEPFFTTKDVGKGSGMGLPMVFGFAKQSGGDVTITSTAGQGTTVSLQLPAAVGVVATPPDPRPTDVPQGHGEHVLLVEDDHNVRQLSQTMLSTLGYHVTAAANAVEARQLLKQHDGFDVMLTDLILPGGVSGAALAHEIRARHPTLPVVFMSGYAAEEIRKREGLLAEDVILDKPFRKQDLARALRERLSSATPRAPA